MTGGNMRAFKITVRTSSGARTFSGMFWTSCDAIESAFDASGDELCGVTVLPA